MTVTRHANRNNPSARKGKRNQRSVVTDRWEKKEETGRIVRDEDHSYVKPPITAKNQVQKDFLQSLRNFQVSCFISPAGVGKSFITMSECTDWLKKGIYDKIILTRPAVGMGNSIGLLKGGLREKYEPYLLPLVDVICERYGKNFYENCLGNGTIEMLPLEYARGRSLNCVVVLEEAQNTTPDQMYTMLTRIGDGKLIIIGDPTQTDIKGQNGLEWLDDFLYDNPELCEFIDITYATSDDIVRSGLCKAMVKARERQQ